MKKLVFVMPLMAISLLASCNGEITPEPTKTYTITFKNDGDPDKKIENIKAGSIVEDIPNPTTYKPDSTFIGWCTDTKSEHVFDFDTVKIYQNYTLYSGWKENTGTTYNVKFNIADCSLFYNDEPVGPEGVNITVPKDIDPCYVKFSVKVSDDVYKKPSDVIINGGDYTDYAFDYRNGDLIINLKANLNITGTCDMYKTLEECTWSQIDTISKSGEAFEAFKVGDEKTVTLLDNGTEQSFSHKVRIIGFNHDDIANENAKAGITFEFMDLITKGTTSPTDTYTTYWDEDDNYDYRESDINTALNDETEEADSVINRLPQDLREVIKPVDKKVGVSKNGGSTYTATSFDGNTHPYPYLFSLAYYEITTDVPIDDEDEVAPNEGSIYLYYQQYKDAKYRIKNKVASDDNAQGDNWWWLRSPNGRYFDAAWCVDNDGVIRGNVSHTSATAPAFCI